MSRAAIQIALAKRLDTFGKDDRRQQYEGGSATDIAFEKIRRLERLEGKKFLHHIVLVLLAAALARIPEVIAILKRFL